VMGSSHVRAACATSSPSASWSAKSMRFISVRSQSAQGCPIERQEPAQKRQMRVAPRAGSRADSCYLENRSSAAALWLSVASPEVAGQAGLGRLDSLTATNSQRPASDANGATKVTGGRP
jgi:hypothetical protein